ncbi:MAG: chromosome partitioning protein ParA [Eggerthellaceae bacterium]|nr:chromosome partitioning protein ParA [Eggerthellaceae bacterium]
MNTQVVLCADSESMKNPQLIGLEEENLGAQDWLQVFCSAVEARRYLKENCATKEVWVASSDDVDPINLAAALKKDSEGKGVYLLAFQGSGSLKSRANAAGIDGTFTRKDFVTRYTRQKLKMLRDATNQTLAADISSAPEPKPEPKSEPKLVGKPAFVAVPEPVVVHGAMPEPIAEAAFPSLPEPIVKPALVTPAPASAHSTMPTPTLTPPLVAPVAEPALAHTFEPVVCGNNSYAVSFDPQKPKSDLCFELLPFYNGAQSASGKTAHILSVVSASGGAGKSTIASLAALFAQGAGHRTLLLDADFQFGDMRYFLGEENPLTIDQVLSEPNRLAKLNPDGLKPALLAAPSHLEQSEIALEQLPNLLESLKASFDVIVVNTGAFWAEQHAALLERSSTALFLVDQRSSSLRACKHALDLCTRCGIATHPFLFAINRCSRNAPLTSIDVSCALQGAHVVELPDGGRDVSELLAAGLPFELIDSRNDLCMGIEKMLLEVLPRSEGTYETQDAFREMKRNRLSRKRRRVACL